MTALTATRLTAGDRVWIATALLHRQNPGRPDFSLAEIRDKARSEGLDDGPTNTLYVHANQHCVANRPPNPSTLRMLIETDRGRRRLFRDGDRTHPGRTGRIVPDAADLPEKYCSLLDWYATWSHQRRPVDTPHKTDPLLALRGSGKKLWADEHADDYVRRLREGWL